MVRWVVRAVVAFFRPRASLVVENLCLRQQILVLQRRHLRPRLQDKDRRFWILASRWGPHWRKSLLIVTPGTVLGWHRKGWKAYWRWRSRRRERSGRKPIPPDVKLLIRRMATENVPCGQKPVQAELAKLGIMVSTRTVAKHMRGIHRGKAIAESATWASHRSVPRSDRPRPTPSRSAGLERSETSVWITY